MKTHADLTPDTLARNMFIITLAGVLAYILAVLAMNASAAGQSRMDPAPPTAVVASAALSR